MRLGRRKYIPSETPFTKNIKDGFERTCLSLIILGYRSMIIDREYLNMYSEFEDSLNIEEDNFTANLKKNIEQSEAYRYLHSENHLIVEAQATLFTNEILSVKKSASKSKVIDFKFIGWFELEVFYFLECKILVEKDWVTPKKIRKEAKRLFKRYIETGIDNFVDGSYPSNGGMIAYVLYGDNNNAVNCLNAYLTEVNRKKEILNHSSKIENYEFCYISSHGLLQLKHIFLNFPSE